MVEPKAPLATCNVFNTKCVNCEPYNAKVACCGFHSGTKSYGQSTSSGKNFPLCHQLEVDNGESVGPAYSTGIPYSFREEPRQMHLPQPCRYSEDQMNLLREEVTSLVRKGAVVTVDPSALFFQGRTSPNAPSSTLPIFGGSDESFTRGSEFVGEERSGGDSGSLRFGEGVLFDPFHSTQVGRSDEASHQPQIPQFLGASTALQDGGDSYATRDCSTGRLVGQTGYEGCVLHSPDRSGTSKVPSFCVGPSPISIYVSPVRSVLRSLSIHQGSKTGCCSPKRFRSSPYCLYRAFSTRDPGYAIISFAYASAILVHQE